MSRARIAVLVSGGGRSLENLVERCRAGSLECEVALVLSDRPGAYALERAKRLELPADVIERRSFDDASSFSEAIFRAVDDADCELVVLAGFLRKLVLPARWQGRVLNIHPSLLPAFGGKGCYGDHVHRAVLERGVQVTGCTVHWVDNEYDAGPIVLQRWIPVEASDSVETLAARVFEEEKQALPDALRQVLSERDRERSR